MEIDITNNYINIQGWMCSKLKLSGNELLIYALIYGFSQDGISEFRGSRSYICTWFNISLPTVDKALTSLVDKGLIAKREEIINNVKYNYYKVILDGSKETLPPPVKKLYRGSKETLQGGSKETLHYNNNYNNDNDTNNSNTIINNSITHTRKACEGSKKLINKSKTKKSKKETFIDKFLDICSDYEFSENVLTELQKFANMLAEMNTYSAEETIRQQLQALVDNCSTDKQRIKVINDTIIRGWKSLIYCISNSNTNKSCKDDRASWDTDDMSNEQSSIKYGSEEFNAMVQRGEIEFY